MRRVGGGVSYGENAKGRRLLLLPYAVDGLLQVFSRSEKEDGRVFFIVF